MLEMSLVTVGVRAPVNGRQHLSTPFPPLVLVVFEREKRKKGGKKKLTASEIVANYEADFSFFLILLRFSAPHPCKWDEGQKIL